MKNYSTRNLQADFYPASGYRNGSSGNLGTVGSAGYSWSCSPLSASSIHGSFLYFHSGLVAPERNDSRALGFPVRCVQE